VHRPGRRAADDPLARKQGGSAVPQHQREFIQSMAGTFKFELVTPERMALSQDATQVLVAGVEGEFTVLPGHAPVISALRPGVIEVTLAEGGARERIFVKGGFAEVDADRVTVLAERALAVEQMDAGTIALKAMGK
jgi:F-type H+-transporting ATPase subunit epsilon